MATKANLVMDKGSDFSVSLIVTGSDGTAFNLTGYSGNSKIRKHWSSNVYHTMSCNTTSDPTGGVLTLSANNAITGNIAPGRWNYDVEVSNASNEVTRVLQGTLTVTPEISY
tara:strand:+ start:454 stop:789 length:336 start_codon:yes stop_codon:yes gene_type:complete